MITIQHRPQARLFSPLCASIGGDDDIPIFIFDIMVIGFFFFFNESFATTGLMQFVKYCKSNILCTYTVI